MDSTTCCHVWHTKLMYYIRIQYKPNGDSELSFESSSSSSLLSIPSRREAVLFEYVFGRNKLKRSSGSRQW